MQGIGSSRSVLDAAELARLAEADATAAEALADAAHARVHELRTFTNRGDAVGSVDGERDESRSRRANRRWRWPLQTTVLTSTAVLATCALLAIGGYLVRHHQQIERDQQRRAEFAAAAGQAVVTLMSIDGTKAQEDVRRIIDSSTGQFRDDFTKSADEFVGVAKESKAVTRASVLATAVESIAKDSAVVLVTAATTITNSTGANQQPRTWRLSVDVVEDGGQLKMSKVDFVS